MKQKLKITIRNLCSLPNVYFDPVAANLRKTFMIFNFALRDRIQNLQTFTIQDDTFINVSIY